VMPRLPVQTRAPIAATNGEPGDVMLLLLYYTARFIFALFQYSWLVALLFVLGYWFFGD